MSLGSIVNTVDLSHHSPLCNILIFSTILFRQTTSANCITVGEGYIFIGCADGIVRIFDADSMHFISTMPRPHYLGVDVAQGLSPRYATKRHFVVKIARIDTFSNFVVKIGKMLRVLTLYSKYEKMLQVLTMYAKQGKNDTSSNFVFKMGKRLLVLTLYSN